MKLIKKLKKGLSRYNWQECLAFLASGILVLSGVIILWISTLQIPDFKSIDERKVAESTKIYDRTGNVLLFDIHQDVTRESILFENISLYVKNATVAIEDSSFYQHYGIEPISILRSVLVNLGAGSLKQGGSTITQQVIKNSLLTSEKAFSRKIKEVILALKLERIMTKEEILTLYLNEAPYGGNIYGVEEASKRFFGISAKDVSLAQSAYLAAIPKAPTYYSPYRSHKKELDTRKNVVLDRMLELNFISKDEADAAKKEIVTFLPLETNEIRAPHFVEFVKVYLENKYGEEEVLSGGLKVTTTLDWTLEQKAEEIIKRYAEDNKKKFNANNAGMIAIDPKTGQILVMVGSRDYFDTENEGNFNITIAHRQPGSAFKPFVYATAFNKGYTPNTVLFDLKTQFDTNCSPEGKPLDPEAKEEETCYTPENYDGKYLGPITLRNALAQSRNIPAIKTLYLAGIKDSIATAQKMGIKGLDDPSRYGLTLVLGGGEVSLLDLTSAYSVFANDGIRNPYSFILKVEDKDGNILDEYKDSSQRVISEKVSREISSILSDKVARTPLYGASSPLDFPGYDVAAKTGTTNDYRDAWIMGYSPNLALGVWAGNNDNTPMEKKVAGFIVAPMWNDFLKEALPKMPIERFKKPIVDSEDNIKPVLKGLWQGGVQYFTDKISGNLATEYTPPETKKVNVIPEIHSILYWLDKNNPMGEKPTLTETDPQFKLWETPIMNWVKEQGLGNLSTFNMPKETDNIHGPMYSPTVIITSPAGNKTYDENEKISTSVIAQGKFPIAQVDFFVNNNYLGGTKKAPFVFNFVPKEIQNISETNEIRVVVYDSVFNKSEKTTPFIVTIN
ncbi:MAG: penicillin-binding protein [Candidatus Vogelbacteria bacterium]|nr:penicillin-binding protein [Candidatus Vogelbacteria bacterium]